MLTSVWHMFLLWLYPSSMLIWFYMMCLIHFLDHGCLVYIYIITSLTSILWMKIPEQQLLQNQQNLSAQLRNMSWIADIKPIVDHTVIGSWWNHLSYNLWSAFVTFVRTYFIMFRPESLQRLKFLLVHLKSYQL